MSAELDRLRELEGMVRHILLQTNDSHCHLDWGVLYPELARLAGLPDYRPLVLPPEAMRRNCDRFIDCFVAKQPEAYVAPVITEEEAAALRARISKRWVSSGIA